MSLIKAKILMFLGQYDNAINYFKDYLNEEQNVALNDVDLHMFFEVFEKQLNNKRSCMWKLEIFLESLDNDDEDNVKVIELLLNEMQNDFIAICNEVIFIIDRHLIPNVTGCRERIFIYKTKAKYCR